MFDCSRQDKQRSQSTRRRNYRAAEFFADDYDDDSDSPYFEPTDLSDTDLCSCKRAPANNVGPQRLEKARKATRRANPIPCAVEADRLPLARPIPLPYDADMFDTWCNKTSRPKRHSTEKYQENSGDGFSRDAKLKTSPSPPTPAAPPPSPTTLARLISQSLMHHSAAMGVGVGVGVTTAAAPTATTPRYYRRATREASRRPSRLCLPVSSQLDPALAARRHATHGSRSQQTSTVAPTLLKLPCAAQRSGKQRSGEQRGEVKIPVQAHVSYVPRADDTSRSGAVCARRQPPRGEIRIPLDVFSAPFLAGPDAAHWTQQLHKMSRQHCSHTKVDHSAQASGCERRSAPLRKRRSVVTDKQRAASDKPPQKHRSPSVRSRVSETILPQAVQSNLDALLTSYETQLSMPTPAAGRRASCTTHGAACMTNGPTHGASDTTHERPWGHRPDPRLIPVHLLKPRKPESVRQREFLATLEERIRVAAQPRHREAQSDAQPSTQPFAQPSAQPFAQPSAQPLAQPEIAVQPEERAKEGTAAAEALPSAESKLNSLLNDLVRSGFDVSSLEQKATAMEATAKEVTPAANEASEPKDEARTGVAPQGSKLQLDPRGFYESLYNQQTLARADFSQQINECKATTPADLKAQGEKSSSRHKAAASAAERRDWQSGDEPPPRPCSKQTSECANYASQDEESVFENQDFWDTLDLNVDLNSVQSFSDGYEGHEDSYKYFRNGQVPSANQPITSPSTAPIKSRTRNRTHADPDTPLQELWRHSERPPVRAKSAKPVAHPPDSSPRPPRNGEYYHWPNYKDKSVNDSQPTRRSPDGSNECHDSNRVASTIAEPSTPATSNDVADADAEAAAGAATDDAHRIHVSKSFIAEVVEETLERRGKSSKPVSVPAKMNVGQAIDLIKRKSSSMNDALCMEIAKALSDRLIDCETAKSEKEYVMQLKKLRSDHLRHISREVKRLQDLEGFLDDFGHVRTIYNTACATRGHQVE